MALHWNVIAALAPHMLYWSTKIMEIKSLQ
jgi:hypothetical protein